MKAPTLQELPSALARLCLGVEHFCRQSLRLPHGAHVLLAISGGADSVALTLILHLLAPRLGLRLSGLSIDHGIRPEAAAEALFSRQFCAALGIDCAIKKADVPALAAEQKTGLEEMARHIRYALLEEQRAQVQADFIALGHHAEDLSEDVLLRLVRGTGWPALGGMPGRDDARHLLRPLLATRPEELKKLLQHCELPWCEDSSNASENYLRNRIRHRVLPLLRAENPSLERQTATLWQLARLDADFWQSQLDAALEAVPWQEVFHEQEHSLTLPRQLLRALHPSARLRLYLRAVHRLVETAGAGSVKAGQARARTLLDLDAAFTAGRGNTCFQFPGGLCARLRKGSISFSLAPAEKHEPRQQPEEPQA